MKLYVYVDGRRHEVDESQAARLSTTHTAQIGDRRVAYAWTWRDGAYTIVIDGVDRRVEVRDELAERVSALERTSRRADGEAHVRAPIPGLVRRVLVEEGQTVAKDQPVLTLDAMKLENELPSPRQGVVKSVRVKAGAAVEKGQVLLIID